MGPKDVLRKRLIRTAATLSKGSPERKALLNLLSPPSRKVAGLPRATRRPPGMKFRKVMNDWITSDMQSKLEAGGVPQRIIDNAIEGLTGRYGPMLVTSYGNGYGSQNFENFETQQDAVDWLAGKTALESAPAGAEGKKRYPDISKSLISAYGGGKDAIRSKARGLANKMKPWQKTILLMVLGYDEGSFLYSQDKYVKSLDDYISLSDGSKLQSLIPFLEWGLSVSKPPKGRP